MVHHVRRDDMNRIAKAPFDAGEVDSLEAALDLLRSYAFAVVVGSDVSDSLGLQAALLTIANAGPRACLGGVTFSGATDLLLEVPWARGCTVAEAVQALGCQVTESVDEHPLVVLGDADGDAEIVLRPCVSGWSGGVATTSEVLLEARTPFGAAGSLAGALTVSEIFQHFRGDPRAGRRDVGLSLWRPDLEWRDADALGPEISYLPGDYWLLGLGHLGQANAWTIGLLPYRAPSAVTVMLQDRDVIVKANRETSMLYDDGPLGEPKTRLVSRRLEAVGFRTRMSERLFDAHQRLQDSEPALALAGFDNPTARRALSGAGFALVVDAGLGGDHTSFLEIMLHSFPATRRSDELALWKAPMKSAEALVDNTPGYQRLIDDGADPCGVLTIAGASVATAFVGCVAAALSIAEACRALADGPRYEVLDLNLRNPGRVHTAELPDAAPYAGRYVGAVAGHGG